MRATEIIRGVLDLIDKVEDDEAGPVAVAATTEIEPENEPDDNLRRFKQIIDLVSGNSDPSSFSNEPEEKIADIDSVTTGAGGGWMAPKNPADIRGEHPSMFPFFQAITKE